MKNMFVGCICLSVGVVFATPTVRIDSLVRNDDGSVVVGYALSGERAIVCFDVTTNGVSVGGQNMWRVLGDVNRVVGNGHDFASPYVGSFTWFTAGTELERDGLPDDATLKVEVNAYALDNPPDYMAVHLTLARAGADPAPDEPGFAARFYPDEASLPGGLLENPAYRETILVMRRIHARGVTWRHGVPKAVGLTDRQDFELNCHVQLTNDFYLGVFRLTRHQWRYVWPGYSDKVSRDLYPSASAHRQVGGGSASVRNLRGDAANSSAVLEVPSASSRLGLFRARLRLAFDIPTSLEWEYACRAGTDGLIYNTSVWNKGKLEEIAWTKENSNDIDQPVGLKEPNPWGLHDLIGGQHEICRDLFVGGEQFFALLKGKGFSADDPAVNPVCLVGVNASVTNRIRAGSSRKENPATCRASIRMSVPVTDGWASVRLSCPVDVWWL